MAISEDINVWNTCFSIIWRVLAEQVLPGLEGELSCRIEDFEGGQFEVLAAELQDSLNVETKLNQEIHA